MEFPVKILIALLFPVIATIIYLKIKRPWSSYLISIFMLFYGFLIYFVTRGEILGRAGDSFFFPLLFFSGNPPSNLFRFALVITGALILTFNASKEDTLFQIVSVWALSSAILLSLADNFLTFFLFWEMLTISTAAIIFLKKNERAYKSGFIFILTHLAGGLFLLVGIIKHYQASGSLVLENPRAGVVFFVLAIAIKTSFIPFHYWLIAGYPAASWQGTVLLSALSTKAGVYAIARVLEPSIAIAYMGGLMAVFGVVMALLQKKMRPLLCYHIISQVGYMVAGVGFGLSMSVDGGLLHLLNHMLYKALLLMSAGAVLYAVGTEKLKELGGLVRKMPVVSLTALIASLAISGIPPFNGFISKTILKYALQEERLLSILLLIAGAGTVISFCKFMYFSFLRKRNDKQDYDNFKTVPLCFRLSMILTAIIVIITGVFPGLLHNLAPYQTSTFVYSFSSISNALLTGLIGFMIFVILRPFLDPSREINLHRILAYLNNKLEQVEMVINKGYKRSLLINNFINTGNSLWIVFFTTGIFISFFILNILLM